MGGEGPAPWYRWKETHFWALFFPPQASLPPLQSLELGEELGPCLDDGPHSAASKEALDGEGASPPIYFPRITSFLDLR